VQPWKRACLDVTLEQHEDRIKRLLVELHHTQLEKERLLGLNPLAPSALIPSPKMYTYFRTILIILMLVHLACKKVEVSLCGVDINSFK
jgi:hypothetical protein